MDVCEEHYSKVDVLCTTCIRQTEAWNSLRKIIFLILRDCSYIFKSNSSTFIFKFGGHLKSLIKGLMSNYYVKIIKLLIRTEVCVCE